MTRAILTGAILSSLIVLTACSKDDANGGGGGDGDGDMAGDGDGDGDMTGDGDGDMTGDGDGDMTGDGDGDMTVCTDADADSVCDDDDTCAGEDDTLDADADSVPDGCDVCAGEDDALDADSDGVPDGCDVCAAGDDGTDTDADGTADACDVCEGQDDTLDTDMDGVPNGCDSCDGDNLDDADADTVPDACDVCPGSDDTVDTDGDSVPDGCDVCAGDDTVNTDGDAYPDVCDICSLGDDDVNTDGVDEPDACDICPAGDNSEDADSDTVPDACDLCPDSDDADDVDGDSTPDACDSCGIGMALSMSPAHYFRLGEPSAGGEGTSNADSAGSASLNEGVSQPDPAETMTAVGVSEDGDLATSFADDAAVKFLNPFDIPASFTVSMWIKLDPGSAVSQYFLSYAVTDSDNELALGSVNGNITFYFNSSPLSVDPGFDLKDGQFHHVAVTYDGANAIVYLDGAEVINRADVTPLTTGGALVFGQEQDMVGGGFNSNQDFEGVLDEVLVYDSALSDLEIVSLKDSFSCASESCNAVKMADASAADGYYWIDPDGAAAVTAPSLAYCDMTNDGGGWTLLMSTGGMGPAALDSRVVLADDAGYMPPDLAQQLALVSTKVHIRSTGAPLDSITSIPISLADVTPGEPLVNLRNLEQLNVDSSMTSDIAPLAYWTGARAQTMTGDPSTAYLWNDCASTAGGYPNLYQACGNTAGLHLVEAQSVWDAQEANEALQVYLK